MSSNIDTKALRSQYAIGVLNSNEPYDPTIHPDGVDSHGKENYEVVKFDPAYKAARGLADDPGAKKDPGVVEDRVVWLMRQVRSAFQDA